MIVVEAPEIQFGKGVVTWSSVVHGSTVNDLWFSLPERFQGLVSPLADAGLLGLLLPAMRQGTDLRFEGQVSSDLYANLDVLQEVVRQVYPKYAPIRVRCAEYDHVMDRPPGVGMGFSAGVDSFAALAQHFLQPEGPWIRPLSHLTFNNVGSNGPGAAGGRLFHTRLARVERIAELIGLPLVPVDSNLDDHFQLEPALDMTAFVQTAFMRNAAAAHVLGAGIGTWLYCGSVPLEVTGLHPWSSSGRVEPLVLPLMSSGRVSTRLIGYESRVIKTSVVANLPAHLRRHLDVCIDDVAEVGPNCSRCAKCMRTMLTLEILGELDNFTPDVFRPWDPQDRAKYLVNVAAEPNNKLNSDILELAAERQWAWPVRARARGRAIRTRRRLMEILRVVRRVIKR